MLLEALFLVLPQPTQNVCAPVFELILSTPSDILSSEVGTNSTISKYTYSYHSSCHARTTMILVPVLMGYALTAGS